MQYFTYYVDYQRYCKIYNFYTKCSEYLSYYRDNISDIYYLDNFHILHNIKGPALIEYINNMITYIAYYIHGQRHNSNGPAMITFIENEYIIKDYSEINKIHLSTNFKDSPQFLWQEFYLNGKRKLLWLEPSLTSLREKYVKK